MPPQANAATEAALDRCIDELLAGADWEAVLPKEPAIRQEVASLVPIARALVALAGRSGQLTRARKERIWERVSHVRTGLIRRIVFYRLPYLPPLWIKPEAC